MAALLLKQAWMSVADDGDGPLTIDAEMTICQVYGIKKEGAGFGYTKVRGYHPLVAAVGKTGDVVGSRARDDNAHTAREDILRWSIAILTKSTTVISSR